MCPPAAMAALSIASSAVGLYGQMQAASAQQDYNEALTKNAITANNQQNAQITQQQQQERDAATNKIMNNNRDAMKAASTTKVAAANAGITGLTVDSLISDIGNSEGRYNSSVDQNLRAEYAGNDWNRVNSYNNMVSTLNTRKTPAMPNYLGAGLQIGTAVDTYNTKTNNSLYTIG